MKRINPLFSSLLLLACSSQFDVKENVNGGVTTPGGTVDEDNDGFTVEDGDCDDTNASVNPDAEEVCDGLDNDCNNEIDDNPTDLSVFYVDGDADGFGGTDSVEACELPEGHADNNNDCDDSNAEIHPEADELCDGIDNDCNDAIDEEDSGINPDLLTEGFADVDSDGFGDAGNAMLACELDDDYVTNDDDCNDDDATVHPDADEVCDGIDNNCNNLLDEDDPTLVASELITWFADGDGDGFGSADTSVEQCSPPEGYVDNDADCDDDIAATYPGAAYMESTIDCMTDADGDGYGEVTDLGCCYEIEMTDSYGDGWNGGAIELYEDGVLVNSFANENLDGMFTSETQTDVFCVAAGSSFSLEWVEGSYDYEVSYVVTDANGSTILSGSPSAAGNLYSGSCAGASSNVASGTDCDDNDAQVYPGAVTEALSTECMIDIDGDGYGDNDVSFGFAPGTDCDDGDALVYPGAVTEALSTECMIDIDGDGYGDDNPAAGFDAGTDCDDSDSNTFMGAAENELTSGCMTDVDGDGYGDDNPAIGVDAGSDCDDSVAAIHSYATETWYDGVDQDCDGANDYDQDGDGYESDAHGGSDCDDTNATTNPMAPEDFSDGIDNNCADGADEQFAIYEAASSVALSYGQPLGITSNAYDDIFMVYHDGNGSIYYRKRSADGSWEAETEIPAATGFSGEFLQAKVDGTDQLQLAYTSYSAATDMYFNFMDTFTGDWSNDIFVSEIFSGASFDSGFRIGFDIDGNNLPSFVFYDQDNDVPQMVRTSTPLSNNLSSLSGTSMLLDNFVQTGCTLCYSGTYASMAIDSNDRAHAVFYNHSNVNWLGEPFTDDAYENQYAYVNSGSSSASCTSGNWISDFNDTYVDRDSAGIHNSVAIRPSDQTPCVAYRDSAGDLLYACKDDGGCDQGWAVEDVDISSGDKDYAALAFNSLSEPYIAYYNASNGDLRLAHKSGSWNVYTIDSYGNVGNFVSIDIDMNDMVHIIYYDTNNNLVKYAYGQ